LFTNSAEPVCPAEYPAKAFSAPSPAANAPTFSTEETQMPRPVPTSGKLLTVRQARLMASSAWMAVCRHLPNRCRINRFVAGVYFRRVHGRAPLPLSSAEGTINDFIFHRMTGGRWTDFDRRCVDKISAKEEAVRLSAGVRVARTRETIDMRDIADASALYRRLERYAGEDLVAKPAHGSGATLWMTDGLTQGQARALFDASREDYFWRMRETQYAGLPRRIVIEEAVRRPDGSPPDDYKFMCVRGRPLLLQVDHDRFGPNPTRRLYRVGDFEPYHLDDATPAVPGWRLAPPALLAEMTALAGELSQPFDYVRIDLLLAEAPYFGEFTFSQGASLGRYTPAPGSGGAVLPYNRYLLEVLCEGAAHEASGVRAPQIPSSGGLLHWKRVGGS
jgi:hypothetical protein